MFHWRFPAWMMELPEPGLPRYSRHIGFHLNTAGFAVNTSFRAEPPRSICSSLRLHTPSGALPIFDNIDNIVSSLLDGSSESGSLVSSFRRHARLNTSYLLNYVAFLPYRFSLADWIAGASDERDNEFHDSGRRPRPPTSRRRHNAAA